MSNLSAEPCRGTYKRKHHKLSTTAIKQLKKGVQQQNERKNSADFSDLQVTGQKLAKR